MGNGVLENLYHVAIAVNNLSAVEEVYTTALGLKVEQRGRHSPYMLQSR